MMNNVVTQYLKIKQSNDNRDYINNIREILQNILLVGLKKGGFFNRAAFYGGTALRIFYGIDRFSEDLDFTLLEEDNDFSFEPYFVYIINECKSYGFDVELSIKNKVDSNIASAFLKTNIKTIFINFELNNDIANRINKEAKISIKFEVDIHPPMKFNCENKMLIFPEQLFIKTLDLPSLFAGKIAAILCREYKHRIKGRDYYDYLYFLGLGASCNLIYLKEKLIEKGLINDNDIFNIDVLKTMLKTKFDEVDINMIKEDLYPFIDYSKNLDYINRESLIKSLDYLK